MVYCDCMVGNASSWHSNNPCRLLHNIWLYCYQRYILQWRRNQWTMCHNHSYSTVIYQVDIANITEFNAHVCLLVLYHFWFLQLISFQSIVYRGKKTRYYGIIKHAKVGMSYSYHFNRVIIVSLTVDTIGCHHCLSYVCVKTVHFV